MAGNSRIPDYDFDSVGFRLRLLYWRLVRPLRPLIRRLRYGAMPRGGWGRGWQVLVFRYRGTRRQLHVLAPVDGEELDWETLRRHVRGEPWPAWSTEPGRDIGVLGWVGHHLYVATEAHGNQRMQTGKLIPGELKGGVDVGFVLIGVRGANLQRAGQGGGAAEPAKSGPVPRG